MEKKKKTLRRLVILKVVTTLIVAIFSLFSHKAEARPAWLKEKMHFTDTLKTQKKLDQFMKAIELAPSTFVYKKIVWKDKKTVKIEGLKFNDSIKNSIETDIVAGDEKLAKNMKKLYKLMKPLNPICDLTVNYHQIDSGLAVVYDIDNVSFFSLRKDN